MVGYGKGRTICHASTTIQATTAGDGQASLNASLFHKEESLCLVVWQMFHLWQRRTLRYVIENTCNQTTFFKPSNTSEYTYLRNCFLCYVHTP